MGESTSILEGELWCRVCPDTDHFMIAAIKATVLRWIARIALQSTTSPVVTLWALMNIQRISNNKIRGA